jgi:hypothetical protein
LAKQSLILISILLSAYSLYFYATRSLKDVRKQLEQQEQSQAWIKMNDFEFRQFTGSAEEERTSAHEVWLMGPNVVELSGNVEMIRRRPRDAWQMHAQNAMGFLRQEGDNYLFERPEVDVFYFQNQVTVEVDDRILQTELAKYMAGSRTIVGNKSVVLSSPTDFVTARGGFLVNLAEEVVHLYGPLEGNIAPFNKK